MARRRMALISKLLRFGVVGTIGFVVDAGTLLLLVRIAGLSPLTARVLSFIVAATTTFLLNHHFTFRLNERASVRRWIYYLITTAFGACINLGIYGVWISEHGSASIDLALGTALGSLAAMVVNYVVSSTLIFRPVKHGVHSISKG